MADLDSGGHDADAAKIEETHSVAPDADDPYDADPDLAAYAAGNNPELAHRYQGQPDSPNSWTAYFSRPRDQGDAPGRAQAANEQAEVPEPGRAGDSLDLWGDVMPDAARYADLVRLDHPDGPDNPHRDKLDPARDTDANAGQSDQAGRAEAEAEAKRISSFEQPVSTHEGEKADLEAKHAALEGKHNALEVKHNALEIKHDDAMQQLADSQQRTSSLEAENIDLKRQVADLEAKDAAREQQRADDRASDDAKYGAIMQQVAKMNASIEELQAGGEHQPRGTATREGTDGRPDAQVDQQDAKSPTIAERKGTDPGADIKDVERSPWRRMTSAENLGFAQTVGDAVQTVREAAFHAPPDGRVTLVLTALGLAAVVKGRVEKRAEKKGKGKT